MKRILLLAAMVIAGCSPIAGPPPAEQIATPAAAVADRARTTVGKVEAVSPYVAEPGKATLTAAVTSARETVTAAVLAVAAVDQYTAAMAKLDQQRVSEAKASAEQLAKVQRDRDSIKDERDQARARYHDAWLGGKTWRAIAWVTGGGILLTLAALFLNAKTDWFVWVWEFIVGAVTGACKAVGTIVAKAFGAFRSPPKEAARPAA